MALIIDLINLKYPILSNSHQSIIESYSDLNPYFCLKILMIKTQVNWSQLWLNKYIKKIKLLLDKEMREIKSLLLIKESSIAIEE